MYTSVSSTLDGSTINCLSPSLYQTELRFATNVYFHFFYLGWFYDKVARVLACIKLNCDLQQMYSSCEFNTEFPHLGHFLKRMAWEEFKITLT
jgi:hypothetical protein